MEKAMTTKIKTRLLVSASALCLTALSLAGPAGAQSNRYERDRDGRYEEGGCVGGSRCGGSRSEIRIPLEGTAVREIRFRAHDDVGDNSRGHLRVRIDDRVLERDIDVAKDGDWYEVDGRGIRGRYLIFETATDDEVVVEQIDVDYGRGFRRGQREDRWNNGPGSWGRGNDRYDDRYDRRGDSRGGRGNGRGYDRDWESYPQAKGCIGGAKCGRQEEIRVRLEDRPIQAIRIRAHDNVGDVSRGRLRVEIDGRVVEDEIDVAKDGDEYEIDVRNIRGRTLTINSFAHDEVVVEEVEVLYGGNRRR
jgi:hypothetical protein